MGRAGMTATSLVCIVVGILLVWFWLSVEQL